MAAGPQQQDETLAEVNVIPLADLSLVLLIILMVISPMVMQSMIKVHSSRASAVRSAQDTPKEPPLILLVNKDGVFLNTVRMSGTVDLAGKLAHALSQRVDKTVMITADPAVQHGTVVEILDITKQQGAEKIALLRKAGASPIAISGGQP